MMQISETRSPQGIAAVVPLLAAPAPQPGERAIYLHEIQDPGNLGTILRTLAWFGGFRCLLSPDSVDLHNGKVVRASMGAIFHVPVEIDVPLDALPARFGRIASLDLQGQSIATPAFREFDCYVFGNEGTRPAARSACRAGRPAFHHRWNPGHRIAERGGNREYLSVRAEPAFVIKRRSKAAHDFRRRNNRMDAGHRHSRLPVVVLAF